MTIGDVFSLKIDWQFVGQLCQNVFFYEQIAGSSTNEATILWFAFEQNLRDLIFPCQSDQCELDEGATLNLMDQTDFHTDTGINLFGSIQSGAAQTQASFVAFGFRLERAYPGAPHGYKRFPGVAEGYTAENVYAPPDDATDNLAIALAATIQADTFTPIFMPVVVHRPFSIGVPPDTWWPVTLATYTNLTTQSSRKF